MSVLGFDAARLYTVEEMPDYEGKLELVDGRLEVSPPAQWRHARIATIVTKLLDASLSDEYLPGPSSVSSSTPATTDSRTFS